MATQDDPLYHKVRKLHDLHIYKSQDLKAMIEALNRITGIKHMTKIYGEINKPRTSFYRDIATKGIDLREMTMITSLYRKEIPEIRFEEDWVKGIDTRLTDGSMFKSADSYIFQSPVTKIKTMIPTVEALMRLHCDMAAEELCELYGVPLDIFRFHNIDVSMNFHVAFINKIISFLECGDIERDIAPKMKRGTKPSLCDELNRTLATVFRRQLAQCWSVRDVSNIDEMNVYLRNVARSLDPSRTFVMERNLEGNLQLTIESIDRATYASVADAQVSDYITNYYRIMTSIILGEKNVRPVGTVKYTNSPLKLIVCND